MVYEGTRRNQPILIKKEIYRLISKKGRAATYLRTRKEDPGRGRDYSPTFQIVLKGAPGPGG